MLITVINPQEAGVYFTHLPVGRVVFSDNRKSFEIGQEPFYSRVNDKEW